MTLCSVHTLLFSVEGKRSIGDGFLYKSLTKRSGFETTTSSGLRRKSGFMVRPEGKDAGGARGGEG